MNRKTDKALNVGLDIGTSKTMAIVGEYAPGETVEVIGVGSHASRGLKRGVGVDIVSTAQSIQRAVEESELMAGCEIRSVYASIGGSHIKDENSHGTAPIRDKEVSQGDLEAVINSASALAIPGDRWVLYKEPQEYKLDGQEGIRHPVGMSGVRLEANVHLGTGAASAAQNIMKCIQRCGLAVDELVPSAVASARAILTQDERELGVCLVDIGAGTTDLAIYTMGAIRHTASLPVGGDQVTNDIAHLMRTPTANAEELKIRYACALAQLAPAEETIQVPSVGARPRRRLDGRRRRTRRGALPHAGAPGRAAARGGAGGRGVEAVPRQRRGPPAVRREPRARASRLERGHAPRRRRVGHGDGVVQGHFLARRRATAPRGAWRQGGLRENANPQGVHEAPHG